MAIRDGPKGGTIMRMAAEMRDELPNRNTSLVTGIFSTIRAACADVAAHAALVHIDEGALERLAQELRPLPPLETQLAGPEFAIRNPPEAAIVFAITMDAINFGSGWFPLLDKPDGLSGYFTIARGLTRWFCERGTPTAGDLLALGAHDCARLFGQSMTVPEVSELMTLYARALNDLGALLDEHYAGDPLALVEAAGHSAAVLVAPLDAMPMYHDVRTYHGLRVPFYKRAQITAADIAFGAPDHSLGRFDDLDELTLFADNLVPHVLRMDEVLALAPGLTAQIDAADALLPGGDAEVELRACAVQRSSCSPTAPVHRHGISTSCCGTADSRRATGRRHGRACAPPRSDPNNAAYSWDSESRCAFHRPQLRLDRRSPLVTDWPRPTKVCRRLAAAARSMPRTTRGQTRLMPVVSMNCPWKLGREDSNL